MADERKYITAKNADTQRQMAEASRIAREGFAEKGPGCVVISFDATRRTKRLPKPTLEYVPQTEIPTDDAEGKAVLPLVVGYDPATEAVLLYVWTDDAGFGVLRLVDEDEAPSTTEPAAEG